MTTEQKEKIISAAITGTDGKLYTLPSPYRHADIMMEMPQVTESSVEELQEAFRAGEFFTTAQEHGFSDEAVDFDDWLKSRQK